jgi:hypothetical protein
MDRRIIVGSASKRPQRPFGKWTKGYTQAELDRAQQRFGLVFPPDLIALLREKRPADGHDWTDDVAIRRALDWPFESLVALVEQNFSWWWPEWGEMPASPDGRKELLRSVVARAPKLIPLIYHCYLPERPHEAGNPVFSVMGCDVIYGAADLAEFFERQFAGFQRLNEPLRQPIKYIPFWSDLVQRAAERAQSSIGLVAEHMRKEALSSLIHFDAPLESIDARLAAAAWGDEPVITLMREHIAAVLQRFVSGSIDAAAVESWANLVEGRDDIQFEPGHEQIISDAIHDLANPVLQGGTQEIAAGLLANLR